MIIDNRYNVRQIKDVSYRAFGRLLRHYEGIYILNFKREIKYYITRNNGGRMFVFPYPYTVTWNRSIYDSISSIYGNLQHSYPHGYIVYTKFDDGYSVYYGETQN